VAAETSIRASVRNAATVAQHGWELIDDVGVVLVRRRARRRVQGWAQPYGGAMSLGVHFASTDRDVERLLAVDDRDEL
jgi:hypothetical protein